MLAGYDASECERRPRMHQLCGKSLQQQAAAHCAPASAHKRSPALLGSHNTTSSATLAATPPGRGLIADPMQ